MIKKLSNKEEFSKEVEILARNTNTTIFESTVLLCEQKGIEVEQASKLLTKDLKDTIRIEVEKVNLLKLDKDNRLE